MKWSWPAQKATGVVHTVDTPGGRRAGLLVRSSTSGLELGLVWGVGNAWMWRTPDGHHGERSSQTAAVRVLRDAHDLALSGRRTPGLPFDDDSQEAPGPQAPGSQAPGGPRPPGLQAPGSGLPGGPRPSRPQAPGSGGPRPQAPRPQAAPGGPRPRPQAAPGPQASRPQAAQAPATPAPPMKRIVWGPQTPDLTNTIASLLGGTKK